MVKAQVLIVEDEGIVAEEIRSRLKRMRYATPAVAFSGGEAIGKAEETRPDVVLMDIRLKGDMDGVEAAKQIRTRFDIPVVYVTAYADEDTLQRAKTTEPYGYILKPFEDKDLHTNIEVAIHKHNMERRLRESEQWLATTLKSIGDAVIATDAKGCVVFMNHVAEALIGRTCEDAVGKNLKEVFTLVNRETRKIIEDPVARVISEGVSIELLNHAIIAGDGTEICIDDSAAPIKDDMGNIAGIVLVFHDITERKLAQEELTGHRYHLEEVLQERNTNLRAAHERLHQEMTERKKAEEKLQELYEVEKGLRQQVEAEMNRRMGFTSALACELKNTLTPLVLSSQVLASEVKQKRLVGLARNICRSASNMNDRIDELLDLARGEIGILELRVESLDPLQILREVIDDVAPLASSRGQSLVSKLPSSLPPVKADMVKFQQIVLNLLNNALRVTPEGGRIVLRAKEKDANLIVEVQDTGPGIAEAEQQRLFEPYQLLESDMECLGGLGLGLALCKMLVELHGGQLWVRSHLGKGSTFGFSLPLVPAK